jgi:hypothetical protein
MVVTEELQGVIFPAMQVSLPVRNWMLLEKEAASF